MDPRYRQRMEKLLEGLGQAGRRRRLRTVTPLEGMEVERDGRRLVNFSSNDYLGLARDQRLRAEEAPGATASRLVCGTLPIHDRLEEHLRTLKGTEACLAMGSGFQTNAGVLAALLDPEIAGPAPRAFIDRLGHASMYEGLRTANVHPTRFRHNDLDHLEELLRKHPAEGSLRLIVTESVFSMDGDRADLKGLADLAEAHDAFLYVDEAHATGILGPGGAGLCAKPQVKGRIDLVMGTFGKALGGYGAFVACDPTARDWLVNRCRAFIYSTALPPVCAASALRALELLPELEAERAFVARQSERVRAGLRRLGLDTLASDTQIIPAVMGSDNDTLAAAQTLEEAGILAVAIRPPTVPPGTGRLRLTLTAAHTEAQVDQLLHAFGTLGRLGA